ncbi:PTS sugar transporter subunit IIC [Acetonema longum]|uniref:Permease IIC component n=1 Tax=Acetonema longum DSM 6540 TaxID=1009370 RepID=F7NFX5_9FIRM|nr:PTS transporter subunit EIIC [Acetonema longum]EGO65038.1 pts family oligomeric beta-glucoside porter component iic [Acetonema longum DSM 6540]
MTNRQEFIQKLQAMAGKLQQNKELNAISSGLVSLLPVLIIGAFSTLFSSMPIEGYQKFLASHGLKQLIALPAEMTTNMIAVYAAFLIAYKLGELLEQDGLTVGIISLMSFLVLTPFAVLDKVKALPYTYLGAAGLFAAIIVGLVSTRIYTFVVQHNWRLQMPAGIPQTVANTFNGLIPGFIVIIVFTCINGLFRLTPFENVHSFVYTSLQVPLQNIGGSFGGLLVVVLMANLLWLFGIHGTMVVGTIVKPIYYAMDLENLTAFQHGDPLPHVIGWAFWVVFGIIGGAGSTFALNVLMAFKSKSQQLRMLGKIALPTSLVRINEPLIFGIPVVLNPILAIPFVLVPVLGVTIAYLATVAGLVPRVIGIFPALGIPIVINAFMQGSWKFVVLQLLIIALSFVIYYPFFKKLDEQKLKMEQDDRENS